VEGAQHPDRDAQFGYLNQQVRAHLADGQPVVSVDTKKKELVGNYAHGSAEWQPSGQPVKVLVHDFPDNRLGKAIPYGVYDLGANTGWVSVGSDHDTASFAVASLRRWWETMGKALYPAASRLLVTADAGGSNGYRVRLWKTELARFAAQTGLAVTVCHFPPGTSKWNKVEHRLFSAISVNWRGRPLVSHEVVVALIAATTTQTGLTVHAELDQESYPLGVKVSDQELAAVPLVRHDFHGEWNYTITPPACGCSNPTTVPACS
jgi:Rhodopirellula transposase DDE domain